MYKHDGCADLKEKFHFSYGENSISFVLFCEMFFMLKKSFAGAGKIVQQVRYLSCMC